MFLCLAQHLLEHPTTHHRIPSPSATSDSPVPDGKQTDEPSAPLRGEGQPAAPRPHRRPHARRCRCRLGSGIGPLVLVVDDESAARSAVCRMVRGLGYRVQSCDRAGGASLPRSPSQRGQASAGRPRHAAHGWWGIGGARGISIRVCGWRSWPRPWTPTIGSCSRVSRPAGAPQAGWIRRAVRAPARPARAAGDDAGGRLRGPVRSSPVGTLRDLTGRSAVPSAGRAGHSAISSAAGGCPRYARRVSSRAGWSWPPTSG